MNHILPTIECDFTALLEYDGDQDKMRKWLQVLEDVRTKRTDGFRLGIGRVSQGARNLNRMTKRKRNNLLLITIIFQTLLSILRLQIHYLNFRHHLFEVLLQNLGISHLILGQGQESF